MNIKLMALYGTITAPYSSPSTLCPIENVVFKRPLRTAGDLRGVEFRMKSLNAKRGLPYGGKFHVPWPEKPCKQPCVILISVYRNRKIRRIYGVNKKLVIL